jgi:DNA-binding MarR family transcriptional regulator
MTTTPAETGRMVKLLQTRHHNGGNAALADLGVSIAQWDALRCLQENPDASQHELAELTFQRDQSFGALAARMEAAGLIERVPGPGRAVRHRLTEKGEAVRKAGESRMEKMLDSSFAPLSESQMRTFHRLLRRVLDADGAPGH